MANWDNRFLELAQHVAEWSKDPSTKVGAVIVDEKRRVISTGYNGFPRGVEDHEWRLNDRPTKYSYVVHAELNAILAAPLSVEGATIYVTHQPCCGCAKAIIQAGIVMVISPKQGRITTWADDQQLAWEMLKEADVRVGR
tara:strand:- start:10663 stop:11082 length:420 start_codon:yes stop_codon:yes gene_type:complete